MADEYYNNKIVTTDGDVLMDLTQDTATPETVLEGKTFHQKSGAPAVGTYRPSAEIEARLRATVGHSSKNLLNLKNLSSVTRNGVAWTVDPVAGTITANGTAAAQSQFGSQYVNVRFTLPEGNYYFSGCPSEGGFSTYDLYAWDYTTNSRPKKWNGSTMAPSDFDGTKKQFQVVNNHEYGLTCRVRPGVTVNNLVFKLMVWDGSISDDTFEPYQIPTDERVSSTDERVSSLDIAAANVSQYVPDPDPGTYWITIIDHYSTWSNPFDIYISTPNSNDRGYFFGASEDYPIPEPEVKLPRFRSYKGKAISFGIIAGLSDPAMAISSNPGMFLSSHKMSRWDKVFDVDTFLDFCDVKDGSSTNYMHIHLCDDGGIRSQAEYEAYIGG